jgi:hypothetical protein
MKRYVSTPQYVRGCEIDYAEDGSIDSITCESIAEWAAWGNDDYLAEWRESGMSEREIMDRVEDDVRDDLTRKALA